ncbi:MAG: Uxx-star family glutaredoxin-like (seleno)protein [Dehalococcoidales bacterium]|nr:Uxx-star family glutaredoxin-like (seleno)protein [Dehalococcoidales bacterium]
MAENKVVVYSTPTCPYCKRAKDYLSKKGISFVEHNVAEDRNAANEMIEKSGQMGVPVITINNEVVVGFNQVLLDNLLSKQAG